MARRRLIDRLPVVHQLRQSVGLQRGMLVAGLVLTGVFVLLALLAPWIAPYSYSQLTDADGVNFGAQQPPSPQHLLGTTVGGYDVLSRVIWGAQTALMVVVVAIAMSVFIGILLGLLSGYLGGWVDRVLVVVADAIYAFPTLLLAIVVAIAISGGQSDLHRGRGIHHRGLHPAVLPRRARGGRAREERGVRRVGKGHRRLHPAGHVPSRPA